MSITRTFEIADLDAEEMADEFSCMGSHEQAKFFSRLAEKAGEWSAGALPMQLQYVSDEGVLTDGGRRVMELIGKYARQGRPVT